jgi:hypothetical protein
VKFSNVLLPLAGLLVAGVALPAVATALPQDEVEEETAQDKVRKTMKARRLLESSKWLEQTKARILADVQEREDKGQIPSGATEKFEKAADWNGLMDLAVASYVKNMDESVMDAAIVFYESDKGQQFAKAQPEVAKHAAGVTKDWVTSTTMGVVADLSKSDIAGKAKGLFGKFGKGKVKKNETAAIATLRNLTSAQAQLQASGMVDADGDGIGEYGTLGELTGTVLTRAGYLKQSGVVDYSTKGSAVSPPLLSLSMVPNDQGIAVKGGYCFRIFLPDGNAPAGFTHESGTAKEPALAGGTKTVSVDVSETTWSAYAWPEQRGKSGNRAFFINQSGDVIQSANENAEWSGADKAPAGSAAFTGAGITSRVAIGTYGKDGDIWKMTN